MNVVSRFFVCLALLLSVSPSLEAETRPEIGPEIGLEIGRETTSPPHSPSTLTGTYDIYFGGIRLADLIVILSLQPDHHISISMAMQAQGLADSVTDFQAEALFQGTIGPDILRTRDLNVKWSNKDTPHHAVLTYDAHNMPISFTSTNPDTRAVVTPLPAFTDLSGQTISPLMALFQPRLSAACTQTLNLFDGQRLSTLEPVPATAEETHAISEQSSASSDRSSPISVPINCRFSWHPISGHTERTIEFAQNMTPLDVSFTTAGPLRVPLKLLIETRYGYVAMKLRAPFQ